MEPIFSEIKQWLIEAGEIIKQTQRKTISVREKSNRKDIVTNLDQKIQRFLIEKIQTFDSKAKILAEEDGQNNLDDLTGRVFIIDPIDGTLNFVREGENFCIMVAVYEEGKGSAGFIYDVMKAELYWGGPSVGVYQNETKLLAPENISLQDGLLGINGYFYGHNCYNIRTIGDISLGIRITGCAGLEMIAMLKGSHVGYISKLCPWDYGAGCILLDVFNMRYSDFSGKKLQFSGREYFLAGTPNAYEEMQRLLQF
ncbi:inositol monophosphatase family protein [Enterococcus ratti]|uniref:Inositol monophosphatase family protein n=1 Tax=Enterococcus ratti TaxID=150033 RepID=A0A1L8WB54_9ENTE|nr:inositol monophosphatase family protein [Enterococcus ratti]OJG78265.1 inositol monophosphatase family protein [Enterococcus ratti]